jgi:hypothetical protein
MFLTNRFTQPQSERLAHEQFIEANAWARPQGTIPHHGTPNLTHTPDWAEAGNASAAKRTASTPAAARRAPHSNEDPPQDRKLANDQSAPPTSERNTAYTPGTRDPISPIAVSKRQNSSDKDVPNFRNFSNISGTSTIEAPDSVEKDKERLQQHQQNHAFERHQVGTLLRFAGTGEAGGRPEAYSTLQQPTTSFRPAVMAVNGSPAGSMGHKS